MDIVIDFTDASLAPSGFTADVNFAARQLDALITNNITVTLSVSWDSSGTILGEAGPNTQSYAYATVAAALKAAATTPAAKAAAANLPSVDPSAGNGILVSEAQAQALGLSWDPTQFPNNIAGSATFGTGGAVLNFSTTNLAVAGTIDFLGVVEHELTHALGRVSGDTSGDTANNFYLMDLYQYASPGTLQTNGLNPTYFSVDGGTTALGTFDTTSDPADWYTGNGSDSFNAYASEGVANTISPADVTLMNVLGFDVACFAAGTHILTPRGQIPVERLGVGDMVITAGGGEAAIVWTGRRRIDLTRHARPDAARPIRIKADSLGEGVPARDLRVSPGHALYFDGHLVPAACLLDDGAVTQDQPAAITYHHIELEKHAIIFAEDTPTESYLDTGNRHVFDNGGGAVALHPDFSQAQRAAQSCAKLAEGGPVVDRIRANIRARWERERTAFLKKSGAKNF